MLHNIKTIIQIKIYCDDDGYAQVSDDDDDDNYYYYYYYGNNNNNNNNNNFHGATAPSGSGLPHNRSFTNILSCTTFGRTPLESDRTDAENCT